MNSTATITPDFLVTNERNIMSVARDIPGVIIEHGHPEQVGGFDFLAYWKPYSYENTQDLVGYVSTRITWHEACRMFEITLEAEASNVSRHMKVVREMRHPHEYTDARNRAIELICETEKPFKR